jgi:hypothetical protein
MSTPDWATAKQVQAWLETDLDQDLKFANGLVLVTNRRLLAQAAGQAAWLEWSLAAGLKLNHHDQAGVGALELVDDHGRLATWRYTLARTWLPCASSMNSTCIATAGHPASPSYVRVRMCARNARHRCHPARTNARSAIANQPSPRRPGRCSACGASPALPLATVLASR